MSQSEYIGYNNSLTELHDFINELLQSQETKLEVISHARRRWAHEISEATLKMAESCESAKDLIALAKDHIHSLQTSLRRTSTAASSDHHAAADVKSNFATQRLPRKQLKKAIYKRLDSLKGASYAQIGSLSDDKVVPMEGQTETMAMVTELLRQVRETTLSMVQTLLSLIAMPQPNKKSSGTDNHRSIRKEYGLFVRVKLTRVDSLGLWERLCDASDVRAVMRRLDDVEASVDDMENELEGIYRRLIRTRASLLNILTSC